MNKYSTKFNKKAAEKYYLAKYLMSLKWVKLKV